jgi:hypothetical protein
MNYNKLSTKNIKSKVNGDCGSGGPYGFSNGGGSKISKKFSFHDNLYKSIKFIAQFENGKVSILKDVGTPNNQNRAVETSELIEICADLISTNIFENRMLLYKEDLRKEIISIILEKLKRKGISIDG